MKNLRQELNVKLHYFIMNEIKYINNAKYRDVYIKINKNVRLSTISQLIQKALYYNHFYNKI